MTRPVFISYSSKDRGTVARLAADLTSLGVKVWWDRWEIKVGDSLYEKIQQGIDEAAWLCAALSPNSISSSWVQRELHAALDLELAGRQVFVLPLLLLPCTVPLFLRSKAYADFTDSYEEGFNALVSRVAPRLDPQVCQALSSTEDSRVESAARAIPARDSAPYVGWLASRLAAEEPDHRRQALVALHAMNPRGLLGYLGLAAKDPVPSIRMQAAIYLSSIRTPTSNQLLHELTQDNIAFVRASARDGLKRTQT